MHWSSSVSFSSMMFWCSLSPNIISLGSGVIADLNFPFQAGCGVTFGGHVCSRQRDSRYAHPGPLGHCLHRKIKHHADRLSLQHTSCTRAELDAHSPLSMLGRVSYSIFQCGTIGGKWHCLVLLMILKRMMVIMVLGTNMKLFSSSTVLHENIAVFYINELCFFFVKNRRAHFSRPELLPDTGLQRKDSATVTIHRNHAPHIRTLQHTGCRPGRTTAAGRRGAMMDVTTKAESAYACRPQAFAAYANSLLFINIALKSPNAFQSCSPNLLSNANMRVCVISLKTTDTHPLARAGPAQVICVMGGGHEEQGV